MLTCGFTWQPLSLCPGAGLGPGSLCQLVAPGHSGHWCPMASVTSLPVAGRRCEPGSWGVPEGWHWARWLLGAGRWCYRCQQVPDAILLP